MGLSAQAGNRVREMEPASDDVMQNQVEAEILFFDDFTAGELDRSKWNVRVTGEWWQSIGFGYPEIEHTRSEEPEMTSADWTTRRDLS